MPLYSRLKIFNWKNNLRNFFIRKKEFFSKMFFLHKSISFSKSLFARIMFDITRVITRGNFKSSIGGTGRMKKIFHVQWIAIPAKIIQSIEIIIHYSFYKRNPWWINTTKKNWTTEPTKHIFSKYSSILNIQFNH